MDKIIITGKANLFGSIKVKGSKNAALPLLISCLLSEKDLTLVNLPKLDDIRNMKILLREYGVLIKETSNQLTFRSNGNYQRALRPITVIPTELA